MNGANGNKGGSKTKKTFTQIRPYLMAFVIVGTGICVGYIVVRCLDNPRPNS